MAEPEAIKVEPMDVANMREQGVYHEINHLAKSATFLAAYEAGDEQALTQAVIYCSGHRIPLWEWLANELVVPFIGLVRRCRTERTDVAAGWLQGKPVTALMRQLMDDARDGDLLLEDDTPEFYASLILERWGWLQARRERDGSLLIHLTDRGREVLRDGD